MTRARVYDTLNCVWKRKCPNYLVCGQGVWMPWDTRCVDCQMGFGVPSSCKVAAASSHCCICLEVEEAYLSLPCGHKIGARCARNMLFAELNRRTYPTPQDYGCPPTDGDSDEAEAVETQWQTDSPEQYAAWDNACDLWDALDEHHREQRRKSLSTCPMCREPTGVE